MNAPQIQLDFGSVMDDAERSQQNINQSKGQMNYVKLDLGVTTVRFLPPPVSDVYKRAKPYFNVTKHFGFMGTKGKETAITCTAEAYGQCPICEDWGRLSNFKDENSKQRASKIRPQQRFIYTVLDRDKNVGVLELDPKAHDQVLSVISNYRRKYPDFNPYDLTAGYWFDIEKRKDAASYGQKFQKNIFTVSVHLQPTPVPQNILENYAEVYIFPEKLYTTFTPDEVKMAVAGDWSFQKKYFEDSTGAFPDHGTNAASTGTQQAKLAPAQQQQSSQQIQQAPKSQPQTVTTKSQLSTIDQELDDLLG